MKSSRVVFLFLLLAVFSFVQLRILDADPPYNLSKVSSGEFGDPGSYSLNARNKVVLGHWKSDQWNLMYTNPVPHIITYLVFRLFGVSFFTMNLIPLFFSLFTIIVIFSLFLRILKNENYAFLLTVVFSFQYLFLCYSKIANRTLPMAFFILLSIYLMELAQGGKTYLVFLSGISLFLSFLSKGKMAYLFPIFLFALLIYKRDSLKERVKEILIFTSGMGLIAIPWYFLLYSPHRKIFEKFGEKATWQIMKIHSIPNAISNFTHQPLFLFYPYLVLISVLAFLGLFLSSDHLLRKDLNFSFALSIFWLPSLYLFLSFFSLRPIRYYFELIFPLFFLTAFLFKEKEGKPDGFFPYIMRAWVTMEIFLLFVRLIRKEALISSPFTLTIFLLFPFLPALAKIRIKIPTLIVIFLLVLQFLISLRIYSAYYFHPEYRMKEISEDIGKAYSPTGFAGLWSPVLSMENKHIPHVSWPTHKINYSKDFPSKKNISLVIALTYNGEVNYYLQHFSEFMKKMNPVARFYVWRTDAILYSKEKPSGFTEAEIMKRRSGIARFDSEASKKWALFWGKRTEGKILSLSADSDYLFIRHKGGRRCVFLEASGSKTFLKGRKNYGLSKFLVSKGKEIILRKMKGCELWIDYFQTKGIPGS